MRQKKTRKKQVFIILAILLILLLLAVAAYAAVGSEETWGADARVNLERSGNKGIDAYNNRYVGKLEKIKTREKPDRTKVEFNFTNNQGHNCVAIGNRVPRATNDMYYAVLAIEFSEQIDYHNNTTGNETDYKGYGTDPAHKRDGKISVVVPTRIIYEDFHDLIANNLDPRIGHRTASDMELWNAVTNAHIKNDTWYNIIYTIGINDGAYIEMYYVIEVDALINCIRSLTPGSASYRQWIDRYEAAKNAGEPYYVKMNKIITAHDSDGFRSIITDWGYDNVTGLFKITTRSRAGTAYPVASVHNDTAFNTLFPEASQMTKDSIANSWHQSVQLLDGTQLEPQVAYFDPTDPANAGGRLNSVITRERAGQSSNISENRSDEYVKFASDTVTLAGRSYKLATDSEWGDMPPMLHTATTEAQVVESNTGGTSSIDRTYKNYYYSGSSSSWITTTKSSRTYTSAQSQRNSSHRYAVWYIPVVPASSGTTVVYFDTRNGDTVKTVTAEAFDPSRDYTYTTNCRITADNGSAWTVVPFSEITGSLSPAMAAWDPARGGRIGSNTYNESIRLTTKVLELTSSDKLRSNVDRARNTATFTLKRGTATGDLVLYVPVISVPAISVSFVNCNDRGATVSKIAPAEYDPSARYTFTRAANEMTFTGASGKKYRLAMNAPEWGDYAPMFAWSLLAGAGIHDKTYTYARNNYDTAAPDSSSITGSGASFSKNADTMQGNAVLYIPVVEVINSIAINYVDDETGETVWTENSTYNTNTRNHSGTFDITQQHDEICFSVKRSGSSAHPAKYTYGRSEGFQDYTYDEAMSSHRLTAVNPTTESYRASRGQVTYKQTDGVLDGYVTLYVPVVIQRPTLTKVRYRRLTTYYTNRTDSEGRIVSSGSEREMYAVTDSELTIISESVTAEMDPTRVLDSTYPTPGNLGDIDGHNYFWGQGSICTDYPGFTSCGIFEEYWPTSCEGYGVTFRYGNSMDLWNSDYGIHSSRLTESGVINTRIRTVEQNLGRHGTRNAYYYVSDDEDPWHADTCKYRLVEITYFSARYISPPEEEMPEEIMIIKGDLSDRPNTTSSGQNSAPSDTKDTFAAPEVSTYNDGLPNFEIGKAIPTTESFKNGVYADSWYGHASMKSYEPTPNAQIQVFATSQYMSYQLEYEYVTWQVPEERNGWHTETGYYDVDIYNYLVTEYDSQNHIISQTVHTEPPEWIYDRGGRVSVTPFRARTETVWGPHSVYGPYTVMVDHTELLPTGMHAAGWADTPTQHTERTSFDLHNDTYNYRYYYVKELNFLQLSDMKTTINFEGTSDVKQIMQYASEIQTPYAIITDPYEGNFADEDNPSGGLVEKRFAMIRGDRWESAYGSEEHKGESGGRIGSLDPKTHIEIQSDLTWKEIFSGRPADRTVPISYDGQNRQHDVCYYEAVTHEPSGRTIYVPKMNPDGTSVQSALIESCKAESLAAAQHYLNKEYLENMGNRLVMHNDTVALHHVTYMPEILPDNTIMPPKIIVGDDTSDTENPDVYTSLPTASYRKAFEQIVGIPVNTYNGAYYCKVEAMYGAFPCGGRSARLTVSDISTHGTDAIYSLYSRNEPIQVHSPVIAPVHISPGTGEAGKTQTDVETPFTQLMLDGEYTLEFDWRQLYRELPGDRYESGYWEDSNEGRTEYLSGKYVRFPFPVIMNGQYYPLTTMASVAGHSVKFTNWIALDRDRGEWERFTFYVPTWVETGLYYDAPAGYSAVYSGWSNLHYGAIEIKCTANNFFNDGIHDWEHYELGAAQENYAATYKYPVQISGHLYGFELLSTNDQTTYGGDDDEADGIFNFPKEHNDFKVGKYNRFGTNELRLTYGEDIVDGSGWKYTLPMTTFKSPYLAMGTVRKGTELSYMLKGILGGGLTDKNVKVEITPSFRLYTKDGKLYSSDSIEVLYNAEFAGEKYIPYGSDRDTEYTASLKGNLSNMEYRYAVCAIGSNANCSYGTRHGLVCGRYLNTFNTTAELLRTSIRNIRTRQSCYGTLSKVVLEKTTMLYSGDESELEVNKSTSGHSARRYNNGLETISQWNTVVEPEFRSSMTTWYGKYRIPNSLWVRIVKEDDGSAYYGTFREYLNAHDYFYSPYEIFEKDGYLVLNFDINVYVDRGRGYEIELHYMTGNKDMWAVENGGNEDYFAYCGKWKNETGTLEPDGLPVLIDAKSGDIAVIDLSQQLGAIDGGERVPGMLWIE